MGSRVGTAPGGTQHLCFFSKKEDCFIHFVSYIYYRYADGSVYVGEFQEGLKHGFGVLTEVHGTLFTGMWADDNFVGSAAVDPKVIDEGIVLAKRLYYNPVDGPLKTGTNMYLAMLYRHFTNTAEALPLIMTRQQFTACYTVMGLAYNATPAGIATPLTLSAIEQGCNFTWSTLVGSGRVMSIEQFFEVYGKEHSAMTLNG